MYFILPNGPKKFLGILRNNNIHTLAIIVASIEPGRSDFHPTIADQHRFFTQELGYDKSQPLTWNQFRYIVFQTPAPGTYCGNRGETLRPPFVHR
jgi:hypothetical protein